MVDPGIRLARKISTLSPRSSVSLTLIEVADAWVALFHMMCPDPGSPDVIVVFTL
jgi:hypothetical protein